MPAYFWSCGALTDRGLRRENNEDNFYQDGFWLPQGGEGQEKARSAGPLSGGVLGVFDGLGGEQAGEFASFCAAKTLDEFRAALKSCRDGDRVKSLVENYIRQVNGQLLQRSRELGGTVGSTMALLVFRSGTAHVLNLGDSRVYLLRGGKLSRLSRDHTLAAYLTARGELSAEEARRDPRRNSLTRHLGGREEDRALSPYCLPHIRVMPGDRFLLCTDGVHGMLEEGEIAARLRSARSAAACAETLVHAAVAAGGRDNATALCAFVNFRLF